MTDEAKEQAIKYLTGKIVPTQNPEQIMFDDFYEETNNFEQNLNSYFDYGVAGFEEKLIQGKTAKGENLNLYASVGYYWADANHSTTKSFIFITDNKYNVVQVITKFSNGQELPYLYNLTVGNDGKFFFTEYDTITLKWNLYLLNNFLIKQPIQENYEVIIRQIYEIPYDYTNYYIQDINVIIKHPQNARYLIIARVINYGSGNTKSEFSINEFTINVGSPNEFINIPMATTELFDYGYTSDIVTSWGNDDRILFKAVGMYEINQNDDRIPILLEKKYTEDNVSFYAFSNLPQQVGYATFLLDDINTGYYSWSSDYSTTPVTNKLYKVNLNTKTASTITTITDNSTIKILGIRTAIINNNVFTFYSENNIYYVGILIGNSIQATAIPDFDPGTAGSSGEVLFSYNPSNVFNLYSLSIQTLNGNKCYVANIIIVDEDNNQPYIDKNVLVPLLSKLYDEDGNLIYTRTLYNKTINGQTTTSSVQVPNQFLNDIVIDEQTLVGETYQNIIEQNQAFTKNQYEEVYVNFANTWNMINKNDANNPILNPSGASRFNQSSSGIIDYEDCQALKYRINYSDDTSRTFTFESSEITQIDNVPPFTYRYTWNVYNPTEKQILSIDIISNDEQTTFQTIDNLNLGSGKLYTLTQDVYVV